VEEIGMKTLIVGQGIALMFFIIKGFIDKKFKKEEREEVKKEVESSEMVNQLIEMRIEMAEIKGQVKLLVGSVYQVGKLEKDVNTLFQKLRS